MWWWLACLAAAGLIFWAVKLGRARMASAHPLPVPSPPTLPVTERRRVSAAARARAAKAPARWIAPGEAVTVADITLSSGMIYVGGVASTAMHGDPDNCVIDPRLPLGEGSDRSGAAMPYWPSYGGIQPRERRAYLEWLAGGRCDPDIGIGYVFLFFYGLERRYFVEEARQDHLALAEEARRLLEIYGRHGAFEGYARRFLDVIGLLHAGDERPALSPEPAAGYDIALPVRRWVGRALARDLPLAADDALLWLLAMPDTRLRAPAVRCFDEFVALWRLRFAGRYPAGLKVRVPRTPLKLAYRAASGAFSGQIDLPVDGAPVPDIAAAGAPPGELRDLAEACCDALEPYSRRFAREPALRAAPEAVLLLPPELAGPDRDPWLGETRDRLAIVLDGHKVAQLAVAELFDILALPAPGHGTLNSAQLGQVRAVLDRLDIGFEPDSRYGSRALAGEGRILLFRAPGGAPVAWEKPAYRSAKCMSELLVLTAPAVGPAAGAEYGTISSELRRMAGLDTVERMRLLVHLGFLFADVPRQSAATSRLSSLPEDQRAKLARAATGALLADGAVSPAGARLIAHIRTALHLPADHGSALLPEGGAAPAPQAAPAGSATWQREILEVSQLLADVSAGAAVPVPPPSGPEAPGDGAPSYGGLDRRHGRLLAGLLAAGSMPRADFEALARSLRLLPDGACETLNEWAFAALGEAVIDGEDPIRVLDPARTRLEMPGHAA